jgi:hypothetical protein
MLDRGFACADCGSESRVLHHQGGSVVHDEPSSAGGRFELRQLRHGATTTLSLEVARCCGFDDPK